MYSASSHKILVSSDQRCRSSDGTSLSVACFLLICFFLWHSVSRVRHRQLLRACCSFTPTRPKGRGDEAAVGWHAKWNTHTQCMPKQLYMRLVMQRSGGLLNFTANQDASVMSLGPLFSWYPAWVCLISSFGSHLLSRPTMKEVCFHRSLREKQQNGSAVWSKQHLGLFHFKTSQWVVRGSYH